MYKINIVLNYYRHCGLFSVLHIEWRVHPQGCVQTISSPRTAVKDYTLSVLDQNQRKLCPPYTTML